MSLLFFLTALSTAAQAATYFTRTSPATFSTTTHWSTAGCNGVSAGATPGAADDMVVCSGHTLAIDTNISVSDLTVQATATLNAGSFTLTVAGAFTNGGTFNAGTSTVELTKAGAPVNFDPGGAIFNNITVNATGNIDLVSTLTATSLSTLSSGNFRTNDNTINFQDLTINGANFQAGASTINISGNFTRISGNFTRGTSTVNLTGGTGTTQTITGDTTFTNLNISNNGNRTIAFTDGSTTTVAGSFSAQGANAANRLNLHSSGAGTFNLSLTGTKGTLNFLDIKNSNASGSSAGNLPLLTAVAPNNNDSLGNSGWFPTPGAAAKVAITVAGSDFFAGGSTTLTVQVQDASNIHVTGDNTTTVTFTPTLSGTITGVTTGTGDGGFGTVGGAETVTVANGLAVITLGDTVAETFEVAITNGGGLTNPANDSITVSPGAASQVVLTTAAADFDVTATTSLTVQVQDANGNLVSSDNSTTVTFSPTLSGTIMGVTTGTGDGGFGTVGGAETVTVAGGIATITLTNNTVETFAVAFSNSGGLSNPGNDSITVNGLVASQVAVSVAAQAFAPGGSTTLQVQVRTASGTLVSTDNSTVITFTPTLNGVVSAVTTGTGDGSYGAVATAEAITVSGGIAEITLTNSVEEVFTVSITNGSALTGPGDQAVTVERSKSLDNAIAAPTVFDASRHTQIKFMNITANTQIAVYTYGGRKLFEATSSSATYRWSGQNKQGTRLASGVYLVHLRNETGSKTLRIVIER